MKSSLTLIITLFVIIGCNFSFSNQGIIVANKPASEQLTHIYQKFKAEHNFSTSLMGPDANDNGIRDDIDLFINMMKVDITYRNVIRQSARNIQSSLSHDFSIPTKEKVMIANDIANRPDGLLACNVRIKVYRKDRRALSDILISLTLNTKARSEAYLQYNYLLKEQNSLSEKEEDCTH